MLNRWIGVETPPEYPTQLRSPGHRALLHPMGNQRCLASSAPCGDSYQGDLPVGRPAVQPGQFLGPAGEMLYQFCSVLPLDWQGGCRAGPGRSRGSGCGAGFGSRRGPDSHRFSACRRCPGCRRCSACRRGPGRIGDPGIDSDHRRDGSDGQVRRRGELWMRQLGQQRQQGGVVAAGGRVQHHKSAIANLGSAGQNPRLIAAGRRIPGHDRHMTRRAARV